MAGLQEMAKDLGQALARTDEYKALKRAISQADDDREIVELRNKIEALEETLQSKIRQGEQPDEEKVDEYEELVGELQAKPTYQKLAAAQANFDKVVQKVNQTISEGLQEGADSRIVMPS